VLICSEIVDGLFQTAVISEGIITYYVFCH